MRDWMAALLIVSVVEGRIAEGRNSADEVAARETAIRGAIGSGQDDPRFVETADLNGDGFVNAADIVLFRLGFGSGPTRQTPSPSYIRDGSRRIGADQIIIDPVNITALSGTMHGVLFLIRGNTTPLAGYTLHVGVFAEPSASGTVTADINATNFYDTRNIITAGGAVRDPMFSIIGSDDDGGVVVTTVTENLSTVTALDGINDVLVQVMVNVSHPAAGDFTIGLREGSVLVDGNGSSVPFVFAPGTIHVWDASVVPTVSSWGVVLLTLGLLIGGTIACTRRVPLADKPLHL
jgi:hypothetical protein